MQNERPDWIPRRLDYYPGERVNVRFTLREALASDKYQLVRLAHASGRRLSGKTFLRLLSDNSLACWIAVRHERVAVGYCIYHSTSLGTDIRHLYVDPGYRECGIESRFLTLACLELPERPTTFTTTTRADYPSSLFSSWDIQHADGLTGTVTYVKQFIRRETFDAFFARRPDAKAKDTERPDG